MKGSIMPPNEKRKSWTAIVYTGRDASGKKTHKWLSGTSEKEVQRKVHALIVEVDNGTYSKPKGTLGAFIERWLKEYARPRLSPRTTEGYESIYRSGIGPELGSITLRNLKPDMIQRYYAKKQEAGASSTTVTHHGMFLHAVLETAVKWQLLPRNPADAATTPGIRHREMHTLDEDDTDTFLETAKGTPYYTVFHCSLYTGLRRSEVLALRWQDVDLIGAEVSVSRSMHQLYGGEIIFRGTKTAKSARRVALVPETCDVLRHHLDNEMALCARAGVAFTSGRLVFCKWDGKPLLPGTITHAWRNLIKRLGYTGVRLHDARHTHATLLFKENVHPKVVQERLGHANISTTLDLYSHVLPGMQKEAAERFGALLAHGKRASRRASTAAGNNAIESIKE
jgi:integrase